MSKRYFEIKEKSNYSEHEMGRRSRLSRQWISVILFAIVCVAFETAIGFIWNDLLLPSIQNFIFMALFVSFSGLISYLASIIVHIENKRLATLMFNIAFGVFAIWGMFLNRIGLWAVAPISMIGFEIVVTLCWISMILGFITVILVEKAFLSA